MREIKFRAWDEKKKRMSNPFSFGNITEQALYRGLCIASLKGHKNVEGRELPIYWRFKLEEFGDNVILMQFTGLKDKNGKEIYEGDIVKSGITIEKVEFEDGCFVVHDYDYLHKWKHCKVIGNIYENPELLDWLNVKDSEEKQ